MADEKQKLTVEIDEDGARETSEKLREVDDAVKGLSGSQTETAQTADKAAEAASAFSDGNANAATSTSALLDVLNFANPALGGFANQLHLAIKGVGDLATKEISLTGIGKKLTTVIAANANTFLLLGAGGLAAGAVLFATHRYEQLKEEVEATTKALEKFHAEQTKGKQTSLTLEDDLNRAVDAREGEVGLDDRKRAAQQAETLIKMRGADQGAAVSAAATTAGMGLSLDELERFAQATATGTAPRGEEATPAAVAEFFESEPAKEAGQETGVRRQVAGERAGQAAEQLHGDALTGQTAELQAAIGQLFGDVDVERLSQVLQQLSAVRRAGGEAVVDGTQMRLVVEIEGEHKILSSGETVALDAKLQNLESYLQRQQDRSATETPTVVNITNTYHGTRNYGAGQGKPDNGERRLRRAGG